MGVLFSIAVRNLKEHRAKTLIVGVLVALGVFLLVTGASFMHATEVGTRRVFIDNFTGHVMVRTRSDTPVAVAGTTGMTIDDYAGEQIPHYPEVFAYVSSLPEVQFANPQIPFIVQVDYSTPDRNRWAYMPLMGIEPESYLAMFPDALNLLEGRFLTPGEQGVVVHTELARQVSQELGIDITVGDTVKIRGITQSAGMRIREVPVIGIYEYAVEAPAMNGIGFIDAQTVRSMAGKVIGSQMQVEIDQEDTTLLDAAFGEDEFFFSFEDIEDDPAAGEDFFTIEEADFDLAAYIQPDSGAWSYILLKLQDEQQVQGVIDTINREMESRGYPVEAVDWAAASSGVADIIKAFHVFFLVVVLIITIVSIIIIMNTLVISVIERTTEIGTMRALGAQKSLVRKLFVLETMTISCFFGLIGIVLAAAAVGLLGVVGLKAPNAFIEMIFGASVLRPVLSWQGIFQALLMMAGIGFLSSLYPVSVALKIQPVRAIKVD